MLLFTAQRGTEPPARPADRRRTRPCCAPGMPALLLAFLRTGAVFGAMEVVTIAFADAHGTGPPRARCSRSRPPARAPRDCCTARCGGPGRAACRAAVRATASPRMAVLLTLPLLAAALGGALPPLAGRPAGGGHGDGADDGHGHGPGPAAHPRGPVERGHDPGGDRSAGRDRGGVGGRRLGGGARVARGGLRGAGAGGDAGVRGRRRGRANRRAGWDRRAGGPPRCAVRPGRAPEPQRVPAPGRAARGARR